MNHSFWWLYRAHLFKFVSSSFLYSVPRSGYLALFSPPFSLTLWSAGTAKSSIRQVLCFLLLLTITRSGCQAEIMWSVFITKSQRSLRISFSWKDSVLCIYHLFVLSNLNFFHNSQLITLPSQSCLVYTALELFAEFVYHVTNRFFSITI